MMYCQIYVFMKRKSLEMTVVLSESKDLVHWTNPNIWKRENSLSFISAMPFSQCCSALSELESNEGGPNKATTVETNQHLLCQQREVPLVLSNCSPSFKKAERKCLEIKARWSRQASLLVRGEILKGKQQGEKNNSQQWEDVSFFFRHWYILPHFHKDSRQQTLLCQHQH